MGVSENDKKYGEADNDFQWLTNIVIEDKEQQRNFYEAQGKEVRFQEAKTDSGEIINGMISLEVKDKVFNTLLPKSQKIFDQIKIDPRSEVGIEEYEDVEARYYRGTVLGFVLIALKNGNGELRSFDPDREGIKSMETTVVTQLRDVATYYAKEHGIDKSVTPHDIKAISSQLDIAPELIKERYESLLTPVVLHFKSVLATENPIFMNEFHTELPVNLYSDLTDESKRHIENLLGMSLNEISQAFEG